MTRRKSPFCALALVLAAAVGCNTSGKLMDALSGGQAGETAVVGGKPDASVPTTGDAGTPAPAADGPCVPAVSSDALHARSNVMAHGHVKTGGPAGVFTADLFGLFQSNCGACHVDNSLGGFHVSLATFPTAVTAKALDRIRSDDPKVFMPPSGREAFSKLPPGSPLLELANLLEAWLAAGRPKDVFYPSGASSVVADPNRYLLSETVGMGMTNLGNCIPPAQMVREAKNDDVDAMFEKASALPTRLEQTDLVTLDSEALARRGVVAFAPAYTLWADNAKKIRMVRVPKGKSIAFDPETQTFDIPPNTRFYKTFWKHVVDLKGNESYRKMETRIIVSRPDKVNPDGSAVPQALFGTYAWNEDETGAVLLQDPLRNGKPWRDHVFKYITDEAAADKIITEGPDDLEAALDGAGVTRTYAIPGSERCIQCHMGAPNKSFVLGFLPLQLRRRAPGEGGVIEPAARDELNQLQRLIDYGVITGMKSPKDVTLLEDSQGTRKPRNDYELQAQGYMLGNCAHCHNPRGFPSQVAPELRDLLNFMPSKVGGIFQFPLDRTSPRIFRGVFQNVPQPYITPGLFDRVPGIALPDGTEVGAGVANYDEKIVQPTGARAYALLAPWRSLIYRNVDAPFTYEEDFSIYPRMPMNTAGYDCRVRRLLGTWMTSIPARTKPLPTNPDGSLKDADVTHLAEPQPYQEALPGDADYASQFVSAVGRIKQFQESERYNDCPDPKTVDIVDPAVVHGDKLVPAPFVRELRDSAGNLTGGYNLRVPERPHFAVTDLTNPPGDWAPRRPDWSTLLVDLNLDGITDVNLIARVLTLHGTPAKPGVPAQPGVVISDTLRSVALTDVPFGLWQVKPGCALQTQPKVADFTGNARPRWMDVAHPADDAPVYSISPAAEIFTQICQNCHGPEADSKGRLANTIADMTGGQTRVANLRDGFFGPIDHPGGNRERVFGPFADSTTTSETLAARYLMFMGLGGTQRQIPRPALDTIRNGTILGVRRGNPGSLDTSSANMLSVPTGLCKAVLPGGGDRITFVPEKGDVDFQDAAGGSPLIDRNGDVELWQRLCTIDNAPVPVRIVDLLSNKIGILPDGAALRDAAGYPPDAPVGDRTGNMQIGITAGNAAPWCFLMPTKPVDKAFIDTKWHQHSTSETPWCPDAFLAISHAWTPTEQDTWATRGAMNAGMAVFLYLDALSKGEKQHVIPYDRCEQL